MIELKRLVQMKRRAEQGDPVVGAGDTLTNGELLELIRAHRVALKELRTIYAHARCEF
jgi:NDP-sugar pyrophosphorylase family protein